MPGYIQIEGDPTRWWFDQSIDVGKLAGQVLSVEVKAPLAGTLVISARAASAVVLERAPGAVPRALDHPSPVVYVPTSAGPSSGSHGYELPASADPSNLAGQITAAMHDGRRQAVALASGTLVLNGATLAFAVVAPANPPAVGDSVPHG